MKQILPILFLVFGSACGGGDEDDSGSGGSAGSSGANNAGTGAVGGSASGSGGGSGEGSGGTAGKGGSAGSGGTAGSSGKGGSGGTGAPEGGTGGDAGGTGEPLVGVCGLRSAGTVTADDFETYEEYYLLGDEGFGDEVCIVRFDVVRAGDAPAGCDEMAGQQDECLWTHLVEFQNPEVVLDEGGACASSELALDAAGIAAIEGQQVAYGYVREYQGHNSVLMIYNQETSTWEPGQNAGWTPETGDFQFDRRDGFCDY